MSKGIVHPYRGLKKRADRKDHHNRRANLDAYRGAREDAILGTVGGVGTAMAGMDFTKL